MNGSTLALANLVRRQAMPAVLPLRDRSVNAAQRLEDALAAVDSPVEIEASGDRMRTAYAPYRRFVSGELDRLRELAETCDAQLLTIADLRLRIDRILDEPDSATE